MCKVGYVQNRVNVAYVELINAFFFLPLFCRVLFEVVVAFGTRGRTNPRLNPCHNSHHSWVEARYLTA
jgi:hypothetical protein